MARNVCVAVAWGYLGLWRLGIRSVPLLVVKISVHWCPLVVLIIEFLTANLH